MGIVTSKEFAELKSDVVLKSDLVSTGNNETKKVITGFINSVSLLQKSGTVRGSMKVSGGTSVSIPITYVKTGSSLMMWGEAGTNENRDQVEVTFYTDDTVKFSYVPVVSITLTGASGDSSYAYGLQSIGSPLTGENESITTTNITKNGFTAQSFGATGSRFTWFASGVTM